MKRQTLAMLIASAFALSACAPQPAPEDKPGAGSAPVAATSAPAAASAPAASAAAEAEVPASELPVIDAVLTKAPEVPPAIDRDHAARVKVNIEVQEKVMKMADGVDYKYWTFNGDVPGSFIRVREGDQVEVHFSNRSDSTILTSTLQPARAAARRLRSLPLVIPAYSALKHCNPVCMFTTARLRLWACTSPTVCMA